MVKRKLSDKDILSLPSLYKSGLSSWAIATRFNTCHSNILHHLKKLGLSTRNRSSAAKEGVRAGRIKIKKHQIPNNLQMNEDLGYILGVIAGDGCISYNKNMKRYQIILAAVDKDFVDKFRKVLYNYFKIKPTDEFRKTKNKNWNNQYVARLCSKEACEFILKIGNFGKDKWKIPNVIKDADDDVKFAFLRGFFDSEGEIYLRRVGATSMNLKGLKEIKKLLEGLGMRSTIISVKDPRPNTSQKYRLRIQDRRSVELFNNKIGFTIKRKQDRLSKEIKEYKFTNILSEELNTLKPKILSLRAKGLSYFKISNALGLNLTTVWRVCNRKRLTP